ncbi:MAG: hypothetical protein IE923_09670 [Micrococcales bacterium]|nr:hypothetical protein [Micrococcales bacterium]
MDADDDLEIVAMGDVSRALAGLDDAARGRVIRWAAERYGIVLASAPRNGGGSSLNPKPITDSTGGEVEDEDGTDEIPEGGPPRWAHFAELYDASGARTHPDGMLVAAYWVQVLGGQDSFGSFELNRLLKDLGHGVTGTAKVMSGLISKRPALILQLKKSGRSQQSRKTYRLTEAGKKAVEQMIANGD